MHPSRKKLLNLLSAYGKGIHAVAAAENRSQENEKLANIAARAGGVNRLTALLKFHYQLRQKAVRSRQNTSRRRDPSDN